MLCGAGDGDPARLRREALLPCRLRAIPPKTAWLGRTGAGEDIPAMEEVDTEPAIAVKLRALVLDDVRWCTGARWCASPGPDAACWPSPSNADSVPEALADVEEAFETTDAFWAARSIVSSRVRRLTCTMWCQLLVDSTLGTDKTIPQPPVPSPTEDVDPPRSTAGGAESGLAQGLRPCCHPSLAQQAHLPAGNAEMVGMKKRRRC